MVWYEMRDSNPRPSPCKGAALPLRQTGIKMVAAIIKPQQITTYAFFSTFLSVIE